MNLRRHPREAYLLRFQSMIRPMNLVSGLQKLGIEDGAERFTEREV
jgi:hypothetical protein